jgi:hypothetical protein
VSQQIPTLRPNGGAVSNDALRQRILWLGNSWDFSWRCKTHKAQLTRHSLSFIKEFQAYVNCKIILLAVRPANVYNADQTNVFFRWNQIAHGLSKVRKRY